MIDRRIQARGFILFEMMFVLSLLGIFSFVAIKLLALSLNVPKQAADRHNQTLRFDSLVTRLREDVWAARSMSTSDEHTLKLDFDDGPSVTWKVGDSQIERKVEGPNQSQTWNLDEKLSFKVQEPALSLNVKEKNGEQGTIRMSSQRMLLQESHG